MTALLACVPSITAFTKPSLYCGSASTQWISSFSTLSLISLRRAGLGSEASPKEIAPEALILKYFSKY